IGHLELSGRVGPLRHARLGGRGLPAMHAELCLVGKRVMARRAASSRCRHGAPGMYGFPGNMVEKRGDGKPCGGTRSAEVPVSGCASWTGLQGTRWSNGTRNPARVPQPSASIADASPIEKGGAPLFGELRREAIQAPEFRSRVGGQPRPKLEWIEDRTPDCGEVPGSGPGAPMDMDRDERRRRRTIATSPRIQQLS